MNLINRLPARSWRHAILSLTDIDEGFASRILPRRCPAHRPAQAARARVASLPQDRSHPARARPAIVHTRNLAALEAVIPAWAAGVPARLHGEHGRDVARSRRVEPALPVGHGVLSARS